MALRKIVYAVIFLAGLVCPSTGDAVGDLKSLQMEFWDWWMSENPSFATYMGINKYNDKLETYNVSHFDVRRICQLKARLQLDVTFSAKCIQMYGWTKQWPTDTTSDFLDRLNNISRTELTSADQVNYDIMHDSFQTFIDGSEWATYGALNPMSFLTGIQLWPAPSRAPSATRGDFDNYIVRLHLVQRQIDEIIESFQLAVQLNRTLHNVSVTKVPAQIERQLFDDPTQSPAYKPFKHTLENSLIPGDDRVNLRNKGRQAVESYINAFRKMRNYMIDEYMPQTRTSYGVMAWDPTHNYYRACLQWHLSFNMTPEEVHDVGLKEVERISVNMNSIVKNLGFSGSVKEFFDSLLNDPQFYSNDTDFILEEYRKTVFERINHPLLFSFFEDIPNVPLVVKKTTHDGLVGGYRPASEDSPGVFNINLFRPFEVPSFQMMPFSLHEAIPGHHLQHSYSMNASLPDFRKNSVLSFYNVPNWFPFYSAYIEGWGLYSEYLGEEMCLYKDDYEMMGHYSFEMLRAVRLVVDTGIHYYGWSRDKAIEYMTNYTSMGPGSAASEIDRYITWPGQACAYKLGEIKIKDLRKTAEMRLGDSFDIREFHSVILKNGPMPLSLLERLVTTWIQKKKTSTAEELTEPITYF